MGQADMGVEESLAEGEESDQEVVGDLEVVVVLEDLEVAVLEDQEVVVGDLEEVWVEDLEAKVEVQEEGAGVQEDLAVQMEEVLEAVVT